MTEKIDVSKILLENEEGKFLVLKKRDESTHFGERWELPGGKLKDTEDRFECMEREVREEIGLEVESLKDVVRVEVESERTVNCFIIHSSGFEGEVELSEEHQDYRWVSPEEFRKMDWHRDAGYGLPPMVYLEEYLERNPGY